MKNNNILNKGQMYLSDGGFETTLVYHHKIELNHFAAFELMNSAKGRSIISEYFMPYFALAKKYETGFILETPTWRSNPDWGTLMGYSSSRLEELNRQSVTFLREIVQTHGGGVEPWLISGCLGPRGDGYVPEGIMSVEEAEQYHIKQIQDFAYADVDLVTAMTINYQQEATGMVLAAQQVGVPVVISFTVETDGRLPNGETLEHAIEFVDSQTNSYASYFMINCAHPTHFIDVVAQGGKWTERIKGIRANASCKSHEELDNSETLDTGDKALLAKGYAQLMELLPNLQVIGGCCGTDHTHMEQICEELVAEVENSINN